MECKQLAANGANCGCNRHHSTSRAQIIPDAPFSGGKHVKRKCWSRISNKVNQMSSRSSKKLFHPINIYNITTNTVSLHQATSDRATFRLLARLLEKLPYSNMLFILELVFTAGARIDKCAKEPTLALQHQIRSI